MTFSDAIRSCLKNYVTLTGRAPRSEFWWFMLFLLLVQFAAGVIDSALFGGGGAARGPGWWYYQIRGGPLAMLLSLALFLPSLAVSVRRLHDAGRSGWWLLISFIPLIGGLVLLFFFVQPSEPRSNDFGAEPSGTPGP